MSAKQKKSKNISLHFAYQTCKDLPYLSYETDKVGQKVVSKWPHFAYSEAQTHRTVKST